MKKIFRHFVLPGLVFALTSGYAPAQPNVRQALIVLDQHQYDEALKILQTSPGANMKPEDRAAQELLIGRCYLEKGLLEKALWQAAGLYYPRYFNYVAKTQPENPDKVALYKGYAHLSAEKWNDAVAAFNQVRAGDWQKLAEVGKNLCAFRQGQKTPALQVWQGFVDNKSSRRVLSEVGYAWALSGEPGKAEPGLRLCQANTFGSKNEEKYKSDLNLAYATYANRQIDQALTRFEALRRYRFDYGDDQPDIPEKREIRFYEPAIYAHLSRLYFEAAVSHFAQAQQFYTQAGKSGEADRVRFFIATAYFENSDYTAASKTLQEIIPKLDGASPYLIPAKTKLAWCGYYLSGAATANATWQKLRGEHGEQALFLSEYGRYLIETGEARPKSDAEKFTQRAVDLTLQEVAKAAGILPEQVSFSHIETHIRERRGRKDQIGRIFTNLGYALQVQGKSLEAIKACEKIRHIEGWNAVTHNEPALFVQMVYSYYDLNRMDDCNVIYYELQKNYPEAFGLYEIINLLTIYKKRYG